MSQNILVYGLGAFGFAVLRHLDRSQTDDDVNIFWYEINDEIVLELQNSWKHPYWFTRHEYMISSNVSFLDTPQVQKKLSQMDVVILAVPSQFLLDVIAKIVPQLKKSVTILNVAKALSPNGNIFSQELENIWLDLKNYAMLAGGMIAEDFFLGHPLGCTIAATEPRVQKRLQNIFQSKNLFVELSMDVAGVECAWAFKNVAAIYIGRLEGKNLPYGTITYYLTQFSFEIQKFARAYFGAYLETFSITSQCRGNDFFMSCTGNTRNKAFWKLLGEWYSFQYAVDHMKKQKKSVEWVQTLKVVQKLLEQKNPEWKKYPLLQECVQFLS